MNALQRKLIAAMSLCATIAIPILASAASITGQGTWETTLQGRDLDGNLSTFEAYYDTSLNITWLADANYAHTSFYDADGLMFGFAANTWAANLSINGYTGWRLPTVNDTGAPGCDYSETSGTDCGYNVDTTTGEMAHMFYATLGNKGYYDTSGIAPQGYWGLRNTGPFSNVVAYFYWSGTDTEFTPYSDGAWYFDNYYGYQQIYSKSTNFYAWAVHSGDVGVSPVPIPAAIWLLTSGLLGLIGVARRKA